MIVLANDSLAIGMRLAGVNNSYPITHRDQALAILKDVPKNEFIIATQNIMEMVPELEDYVNVVTFPDKLQDFSNIDDLQSITKTAIGSEVEL